MLSRIEAPEDAIAASPSSRRDDTADSAKRGCGVGALGAEDKLFNAEVKVHPLARHGQVHSEKIVGFHEGSTPKYLNSSFIPTFALFINVVSGQCNILMVE